MHNGAAIRSGNGFTILESMVALAILGLVVVALLRLVAGASATTAKDHAYTEAMALAEQRIETLLARGGEAALASDGEEDTFAPPFEQYRARVRAERLSIRSLVELGVMVSWNHAGGGQVDLVTRTGLVPSQADASVIRPAGVAP
jgi:prepilin-type N-terminal cleavage/methylation domain-containing protein